MNRARRGWRADEVLSLARLIGARRDAHLRREAERMRAPIIRGEGGQLRPLVQVSQTAHHAVALRPTEYENLLHLTVPARGSPKTATVWPTV